MKPLYDFSGLALDRTVSPRDTMMVPGREAQYFEIGQRGLEWVRFSADLCRKPHYPRILDLGCGYGRVLRWLRAHFHYAEITACDVDRDAVDFCCQRWGAKPAYSQPDVAALPFRDSFDLIWCGSLLTHLDESRWHALLDSLVTWTAECGVIVFTTQGRYYASALARKQPYIADDVDQTALLRRFREHGFAYERYFSQHDGSYGIALSSPEWLARQVQRRPGLILRSFVEEAWGMQDIVILYKASSYFMPVLGTVGG